MEPNIINRLFPGSASSSVKLQQEVVECEMRLAFYDDSTRSVMVLAQSDENIDAMEELRRLVQETVRLELLVVQRHGSQIMRAPV